MRPVLIDTHIIIWWLAEPEKLLQKHKDIISDPENVIYVSIASIWEISLKEKIGKLSFEGKFEDVIKENGFELLALSLNHLEIMRTHQLPNKDPFDMIIVSQAISEDLSLISYDTHFKDFKGIL
ncbi:MAG: type II toxin-antitoxin system VapC family toxin [Leadbetterella sp.]